MLEEPVDGAKHMQQFSKGEFDATVEIALLAVKQTNDITIGNYCFTKTHAINRKQLNEQLSHIISY